MQAQRIEILAARQAEAEKALKKLVKRAHKAGNTDIKFAVVGTGTKVYQYEVDNGDGEKFLRSAEVPTVIFEVTGEAPKYAGYELLMRIEFCEVGVLYHLVPGCTHEVGARFYAHSTMCEHCNKKRSRNDVYIVRHESGKQMQIGRRCLRDFLGIDDPNRVLRRFAFWQALSDFERDDYRQGCGWAASTLDIMALAATVIKVDKCFASRKAVEEGKYTHTTSSIVKMVYDDVSAKNKMTKRYTEAQDKADTELAQQTIDYFTQLEQVTSDYERNLQTILSSKTISDGRHLGLAVSAIAAYQRAMGRIFEKSEQAKLREAAKQVELSEDRQEIVGTIVTTKSYETQYGTAYKMLVQREDGVRFWGSIPSAITPQIGGRIKFFAKVVPKEPGFAFFSRPTKAELMQEAQ